MLKVPFPSPYNSHVLKIKEFSTASIFIISLGEILELRSLVYKLHTNKKKLFKYTLGSKPSKLTKEIYDTNVLN